MQVNDKTTKGNLPGNIALPSAGGGNIAADIPLKETFSTKQMPRAVPQASEARVEK